MFQREGNHQLVYVLLFVIGSTLHISTVSIKTSVCSEVRPRISSRFGEKDGGWLRLRADFGGSSRHLPQNIRDVLKKRWHLGELGPLDFHDFKLADPLYLSNGLKLPTSILPWFRPLRQSFSRHFEVVKSWIVSKVMTSQFPEKLT